MPCGSDIKVGSVDYNSQDSSTKQEVHKKKVRGLYKILVFGKRLDHYLCQWMPLHLSWETLYHVMSRHYDVIKISQDTAGDKTLANASQHHGIYK